MRVGWIGLGRLGLPCATAAALQGHDVVGHDLDARRMSYDPQPYVEQGPYGGGDFNDWLAFFSPNLATSVTLPNGAPQPGSLRFGSLEETIGGADIIFVAVQTPHDPRFEGNRPLPEERADFDYTYLRRCAEQIAQHVTPEQTVVIMSTVLPGTTKREIVPVLGGRCRLLYQPCFIAMSTTMRDYLDPEFVLVGCSEAEIGERLSPGVSQLRRYWEVVSPDAPIRSMSYESAELAKVAYNTAIGTKIVLANTIMELCHEIPDADVDDVTGALQAAHRRITSGAYMSGGMGDSGGCHPRDNIAMSWLARHAGLSHNLFDDIMRCRDDQARWLAEMMAEACRDTGLKAGIYGVAYKPEVNIATGSSAVLVAEFFKRLNPDGALMVDPVISGKVAQEAVEAGPRVWLIGCAHEAARRVAWLPGSVILDPFRMVPDANDVRVIRIGEGRW